MILVQWKWMEFLANHPWETYAAVMQEIGMNFLGKLLVQCLAYFQPAQKVELRHGGFPDLLRPP